MARRVVVEVQCGRCERKELVTWEEGKGKVGVSQHTFSGSFTPPVPLGVVNESHVVFDDLCTPCQKTVLALLSQIGKKIDGLSPDRKEGRKSKAKKEEPPNNYVGVVPPPVHHAVATTKASGRSL
jgi:hypothetical protein